MKAVHQKLTKYISFNMLGTAGLSCYILADTYFVAKGLGSNGLAALNIALPIYNLIYGVGMMIGMGAATRFSLEKSSRKTAGADLFTQAFYLVLFFGLIFVCLGLFANRQITALFQANEEVFSMTQTYLTVVLLFAPFFLMNHLLLAFIRNDGSPNLAMAGMLSSSLANTICDYIFIFPCGMGMLGAVLATGLSPIFSMAVLSVHFIRKKNQFRLYRLRPRWERMKTLLALGVSSLVTEFSNGIVILVFNTLLLGMLGNLGVAAYGVLANIALVILAIFTGISQGMQPIVSQSRGAGRWDEVTDGYRFCLVLSLLIALFIYVFCVFFQEPIIMAFNEEKNLELLSIASEGLVVYFIGFLFAGANIITCVYFSAIGVAQASFLLSLLRGLLLIVPSAILLSMVFGVLGVWLAFPVTEGITSLVAIACYRWERKKTAALWRSFQSK